jgi:hypothetical protein
MADADELEERAREGEDIEDLALGGAKGEDKNDVDVDADILAADNRR